MMFPISVPLITYNYKSDWWTLKRSILKFGWDIVLILEGRDWLNLDKDDENEMLLIWTKNALQFLSWFPLLAFVLNLFYTHDIILSYISSCCCAQHLTKLLCTNALKFVTSSIIFMHACFLTDTILLLLFLCTLLLLFHCTN